MKETSAKLPVELVTLQKELEKFELRVKRQEYICGVADEDVFKAQANLNAII